MKSIMHKKSDRTCYLCMMLHSDYSEKQVLQEHHVVFGTGNRTLSEKYGLKVYLCLNHHENGKEAVHQNREIREMLEKEAQRMFERMYPALSFLTIFRKNCLFEEDRQIVTGKEVGFHIVESPIEELAW